jgi:hypothetical protein
VLQKCYKSVTRVLQECYKSVTRVLQECYKSVTRVLQELQESYNNSDSTVFARVAGVVIVIGVRGTVLGPVESNHTWGGSQGCYKSVTRVLRECYESVTRALQGCYKV